MNLSYIVSVTQVSLAIHMLVCHIAICCVQVLSIKLRVFWEFRFLFHQVLYTTFIYGCLIWVCLCCLLCELQLGICLIWLRWHIWGSRRRIRWSYFRFQLFLQEVELVFLILDDSFHCVCSKDGFHHLYISHFLSLNRFSVCTNDELLKFMNFSF